MKNTSLVSLVVVVGGFLVLGMSAKVGCGATEVQKAAAVRTGLNWLAQQQQANGRWLYFSGSAGDDTAVTGNVLQAFMAAGFCPGQDAIISGNNYGDVTGRALNFIFSQAATIAIGMQPWGNPDSNGNGMGVKFVPGGPHSRDTFVLGSVIPTIIATGTPGAVVTVAGPINGWTYAQVVQDAVDYLAFGQTDSGQGEGGWRYYANFGSSDQSCSHWPILAMLTTRQWGIDAPSFVENELDKWLMAIQSPANGGAYYTPNDGWTNIYRTGAFLSQKCYTYDDPGNAKVLLALNYINLQWTTTAYNTWDGNFGNPMAMWGVFQGLRDMVGLNDSTWITNLHTPGPIDPGDTWTWSEDYCQYLVTNQYANGSWNQYAGIYPATQTTAWFLHMLVGCTQRIVDMDDLIAFADRWLNTGTNMDFDVDHDGDIDLEDYALLAGYWQMPCPCNWPWW